LSRGYSIVRLADGSLVRDGATLKQGDALKLRFAKGGSEAVVIKSVPD
jgi:exonuclease VII large subunit